MLFAPPKMCGFWGPVPGSSLVAVLLQSASPLCYIHLHVHGSSCHHTFTQAMFRARYPVFSVSLSLTAARCSLLCLPRCSRSFPSSFLQPPPRRDRDWAWAWLGLRYKRTLSSFARPCFLRLTLTDSPHQPSQLTQTVVRPGTAMLSSWSQSQMMHSKVLPLR